MKNIERYSIWLALLMFLVGACKTGSDEPEEQYGKIQFHFEHMVDGQPLVVDQMIYKNEAGNEYLVNEIQYFISDVRIQDKDGYWQHLDSWEDIHYVDTDIETSWTYPLKDDIPPGNYQKIIFTFGIDEGRNQSLMFVNPPESYMFWPEHLGGGYHYMKLNGKWLDTLSQVSPFNFHLGIGQIYQSFPDSISEFVHNNFDVELANSEFEIQAGQTLNFTLTMNIENWFRNPNVYDHNKWGGDIMQKQDAMHEASENGWNVFTIKK